MVKDSCMVWTQMQMLIPNLLPKTSEVFGSRVLASLNCLFWAFFFFPCCSFVIGNAARALG